MKKKAVIVELGMIDDRDRDYDLRHEKVRFKITECLHTKCITNRLIW